MSKDLNSHDMRKDTSMQTTRPSSPRKFFARIYGHLEDTQSTEVQKETLHRKAESDSDSCSDVEIGDNEDVRNRMPQIWAPPAPMPLCPRPMLLPHQQLAFGAGLAAFRK
ncbi:unnamed protein product, partial [Iphiclides podalirius]